MNQNSQSLNQQLDAALVQQAMSLIAPARRIALLAHERPDGDCIGSALGLAHILWAYGKDCVPVCADPPPTFLTFLPAIESVVNDLGNEDFDLVIALDAGVLYRFGTLAQRHQQFLSQVPILNIDHHLGDGGCGQINIIDTSAAATAEMLVLFQQQAKLPLPEEAALCLLTGIITDTGSFQYTNTTARTLEAAAELLRHGAVPDTVVQPIFREQSLAQLRLEAAVIEQARTSSDGQLIWSWASQAMLEKTGSSPDDDGRCVGMLRDVSGVKLAVFFKNYDASHETRVSMRSSEPYNVAEFCSRISNGEGGGHARAAGATIHLPLEEAITLVISALEKELV